MIRDEDLYAGVRITMDCAIGTALVTFRLDVNFGDPITPAPQLIDLPALRPGDPPVRVLGYPLACGVGWAEPERPAAADSDGHCAPIWVE